MPEPLNSVVTAMEDAATPLANHPNCWVHFYMILGMILTAIYGAVVIGRRSSNSRRLLNQDKDVMGDTAEGTQTAPAAGSTAHQPNA